MPSTTAQTIINAALTNLGLLEQGGTPSVSDSNDALAKLNMMLGQWRIQELLIWSVGFSSYSLVANQKSYSIGPAGADFNTARPDWIERASVTLAGPNPANPVERTVRVTYSPEEFQLVPDKDAAGAIPDFLYCDRASPISLLYPWPVPRCVTATKLVLYTWAQIADFATLATSADLPDGYAEAIANGLATRLVPSFGSVIPPQIADYCAKLALGAEQSIARLNAKARGLMIAPESGQPTPAGRQ